MPFLNYIYIILYNSVYFTFKDFISFNYSFYRNDKNNALKSI